MDKFLAWFESTRPIAGATATATINGIARAALVHLWFESIHPFEDGNGHLGRALADMALVRVYGMARQMLKTRAAYYDTLNHAQRLRGIASEATAIDTTPWVQWPGRPKGKRASLGGSEPHAVGSVKALSSMTNEKYAKITGTSKATRYAVNVPGWAQPVVRP
jgi:hypothetical protein